VRQSQAGVSPYSLVRVYLVCSTAVGVHVGKPTMRVGTRRAQRPGESALEGEKRGVRPYAPNGPVSSTLSVAGRVNGASADGLPRRDKEVQRRVHARVSDLFFAAEVEVEAPQQHRRGLALSVRRLLRNGLRDGCGSQKNDEKEKYASSC